MKNIKEVKIAAFDPYDGNAMLDALLVITWQLNEVIERVNIISPKGGEIMSTLQYVQPTDEQKEVMQKFRDKYETLFNELKELPSSRGMSLAITKLEESAMWLNKAITKND